MLRDIAIQTLESPLTLDEYEERPVFMPAVRELRAEARQLAPEIGERTVWMVNSTERGGGVAEMLPKLIAMLRECGVDARWLVLGADQQLFFEFTKRIHNMIHGAGGGEITREERECYEAINRRNADELKSRLKPGDILLIHDPQPLAMGHFLKQEVKDLTLLWRCHIGLDERTEATKTVWRFLRDYAGGIDHAVFSATEYIPSYLAGRSSIIYPALDPLSHKNRSLSAHKLTGILCNARLSPAVHPVVTSEFEETAQRLQGDGTFADALTTEDVGYLYRPVVTQISRWDHLKGFFPLLKGFALLKQKADSPDAAQMTPRHRRRLQILRLTLAGPDPASIADDPEGQGVLDEMAAFYKTLDPALQKDIAVMALPMGSRKNNALMVNALQRCSTIVVQNSLREGFGLTVAEAMWKGIAPLGTRAVGIRQQVRNGIDGYLVRDPEDPEEIASTLDRMLQEAGERAVMGENARRRCYAEFLIFTQVRRYLRLLADPARGAE